MINSIIEDSEFSYAERDIEEGALLRQKLNE